MFNENIVKKNKNKNKEKTRTLCFNACAQYNQPPKENFDHCNRYSFTSRLQGKVFVERKVFVEIYISQPKFGFITPAEFQHQSFQGIYYHLSHD